jgi:hypothetical protein
MTGSKDFLTVGLHHANLQVDTSDPNPRPMIAVLDAKPGLADAFRERIVELIRQVRRGPGCATFTAYEARDTPRTLLPLRDLHRRRRVRGAPEDRSRPRLISAIPALSTGGPASLVQLNEIPIPDSDPARPTPTMPN